MITKIIHALLLVCAGLCWAQEAEVPIASGKRPNVVVILADDLGWNDISLHGGQTPTPNIDKLAAQGVQLDNLVVNSVCSPTRAAFLTGMHSPRNGFGAEVGDCLNAEFRTIAQAFRGSGYRTGLFGKWHNGSTTSKVPRSATPLQVGFDRFIGFFGGGTDYYDQRRSDARNWFVGDSPVSEGEGYTTELITDASVEFIKECGDAPFLCVVAEAAPHEPFQATDALLQRVPESLRSGIELTEEIVRTKSRDPNKKVDRETWEFGGFTEAERRVVYSAMLIGLDDSVGRVMKTLEEKGIEKDTIVLFFSDNGAMQFIREGNLPLRGWKHELYDGGVHVPAFLVAPGKIKPGSNFEPLVRAEDLYPTLASLAGVPLQSSRPFDGVSFAAALEGKGEAPVVDWNGIFVYYGAHRNAEWKLIARASGNELYNLRNDPSESKDVAAENPEVVKSLRAKHDAWLKDVSANVNYSPAQTADEAAPVPEGEVLELVVPTDFRKPKHMIEIPVPKPAVLKDSGGADNGLQAEPGDRLVYDICYESVPANSAVYVSADRSGASVFSQNCGVDSEGNLVAVKTGSAVTSGQWKRHVIGVGNLAAMRHAPLRLMIEAPPQRKEEIRVLLDNIHILKLDGRKVPYWNGGAPPPAGDSRIKLDVKSQESRGV